MTPELEQRLSEEAARRGQSLEEAVPAILRETLARPTADSAASQEVAALFAALPRRTPADLLALAAAQGVKPVQRFEDLLGDFWPEGESGDDFLAWLREGRRDSGKPEA